MDDWEQKRTDETRQLEECLRPHFRRVDAYRQNSVAIRVRVIDEMFRGKGYGAREKMVLPYLAKLPEAIQYDVSMLLMLTPDEAAESPINAEFEQPLQSAL